MPELPEVEAARRAIEDNCLGKKIVKSLIADDSKVIDGVSRKDFEASLNGKTIVAAHRKGKNMWLQLDSPPFPSFQFGMAGAVYIKGVAVAKYKRSAVKDTDEWPSKYSKFFIELNDGLELSFTDKRRFAKVRLLENPAVVPPISELGPDALLQPMAVDEFYDKLQKKNIGIKALLLDQGFISGIGNWIADEVLYQARIHPQQIASSISKEDSGTLLSTISEVISEALDVGADGSQFPSNWIFHSREKKPGKAFIDGKKIEFITAGGRTTAYVPDVQKLTGGQMAKASKSSARRTKESNGGDGPESEEDAKDTGAKATRVNKTNKSKSSKGKSKGSIKNGINSDDNDSDPNEDLKETQSKKTSARDNSKGKNSEGTEGRKTKTAGKRKSVEIDDSAEDEDDIHGVAKTSGKKVVSGQNRKQVKKKAK